MYIGMHVCCHAHTHTHTVLNCRIYVLMVVNSFCIVCICSQDTGPYACWWGSQVRGLNLGAGHWSRGSSPKSPCTPKLCIYIYIYILWPQSTS